MRNPLVQRIIDTGAPTHPASLLSFCPAPWSSVIGHPMDNRMSDHEVALPYPPGSVHSGSELLSALGNANLQAVIVVRGVSAYGVEPSLSVEYR